ncbi:outer membrane protein assembly factor BamA [Pseudohongiella spirulinae]|uniref:Outer membrane protein assembly factor BamA n=1 Tax=Pseudohongiella spirulinae TaxID=1249552 RepID=A0A0S2KCJ5_9GAMM|nr:outer membrane protein assembly factor BamA [Pseudohongiella spirulinae]ALO46045.1 Outer membrane protein assembly factor BamA [Pseudohongiella spirulinae]
MIRICRSVLLSSALAGTAAMAISLPTFAQSQQQSFEITDIRIDGLQRISPGVMFSLLPVSIGDEFRPGMAAEVIRSITESQYFEEVEVAREDGVILITVLERPSVSEINISGNRVLQTEDILNNMASAEIVEGGIFTRSTLEAIRQGIQEVYSSRGRYGTTVDIEVTEQPRNRVAIDMTVNEGQESRIRNVNLVGNNEYDSDELLDLMDLGVKPWYLPFSGRDKYSREQLEGDLERITSYYLDSGFARFNIDSTPVSVTPDNENIYITINVNEGQQYQVSRVDLVGDLVNAEALLRAYTLVGPGQTYSQALITASEEYMTQILGNLGYAFANVEGVPEVNDDDQTVEVIFYVEPGARTYVNRISYRGNVSTADDVLRREMRQLESAPASSQQIELSKIRLERLGYFSTVEVQNVEVPGTTDQIDVEFDVEEQNFGSISFSVGSGGGGDWFIATDLQAENFLGTGRTVSVGLNRSYFSSSARFSYVDPYYTPDGVSRGFSLFAQKQDSFQNVASFSTTSYGGSLSFSYPINEIQQIGYTVGYSHTELTSGSGFSVQEIEASPRLLTNVDRYIIEPAILNPWEGPVRDAVTRSVSDLSSEFLNQGTDPGFIDKYGRSFDNFTITTNWIRNTLNRGQLATRGSFQQASAEVTLPGSDLEYYRLSYNTQYYRPIYGNSWVFHVRTNLGFGDGYGDTKELPFFQNYFAGGLAYNGVVRGFEENSLGPRSTPPVQYRTDFTNLARDENGVIRVNEAGVAAGYDGSRGYLTVPVFDQNGQPVLDENGLQQVQLATETFDIYGDRNNFGGNLLTTASFELLFPMPFVQDRGQIRSSFFVDVGSVFSTDCTLRQQRFNSCSDFDVGQLRYSVGVGVTYLSPFGPLTFYLAKPFSRDERDQTKSFDFTIGAGF